MAEPARAAVGASRRLTPPDGTPRRRRVRFTFGGRRHEAPRRRHDRLGARGRTASTSWRTPSSTTGRAASSAPTAAARTAWCDVDGQPNVRACVTPLTRGDEGPAAERVAVDARRPARADRPLRSPAAGRLLLQDLHPAAVPVAALREGPAAGRRASARSTRRAIPTSHQRRRNLHADVAVIGGGPAGCLAALEAAAAGAQRGPHRRPARARWPPADPDGHGCTATPRIEGAERAARPSSRLAGLVAASRASGTSPRATAVGIYEGRLVAVSQGETLHPRPSRPDRRGHRRARAAR